jgi:hypothetical protein
MQVNKNDYNFYNSQSLKKIGKKSLQSFLGSRFFKIGYVKQMAKQPSILDA